MDGALPNRGVSAARCAIFRTRGALGQRWESTRTASCPRLSRASTSFLPRASKQDVDGRDKPGHDSGGIVHHDRHTPMSPPFAIEAYLTRYVLCSRVREKAYRPRSR